MTGARPAPEPGIASAGVGAGAMQPGRWKRWVLGARPRTLPAAVVPVVVGTAAAHPLDAVPSAGRAVLATTRGGPAVNPWWMALGALVVAVAIQVGTNYANDFSDGVRGTDDARVGPLRLVASGLAAPRDVRRSALIAFGVVGVTGLLLAWATSWWVLVVGVACLAAGWCYTGGPRPYGYAGFGELFVFAFFGLVATVGTFYVQTLRVGLPVVWGAAAAVGLLATALLLANNLRDISSDTESGKRTLAVRLGRPAAGRLYLACVALPFVGVLAWVLLSVGGTVAANHPAWAFLPLAGLPLVVAPARMAIGDAGGRELLPMLAATSRLQLAFGGLLAISLWGWVS